MFVTAIFSIKGGVGKTAAAVNLATLASMSGDKTLLIDLDPQSSSTFYLKVKPRIQTTVKKLLKKKSPIEKHIKATDFIHLDILPASIDFREFDPVLEKIKRPADRIREMIEPLEDKYRWVFIDCPPGMTLLADAIFRASDLLMVPVVPTTLSVRTYGYFREYIFKHPLKAGSRYLGFFSMSDRRKSLHREILDNWDYQKEFFSETSIPYLSEVERMGITRKPVVSFRPASEASLAFTRLWAEIKKAAGSSGSLED